jgi:hypothetical protein
MLSLPNVGYSINELSVVDIESTYLSDSYNEKNDDLINFDLKSFNKNDFEDKIDSDYFIFKIVFVKTF